MSSDWAVTGAEIGAAPTWEAEFAATGEQQGGMMLRIEGLEVLERELEAQQKAAKGKRKGPDEGDGLERSLESLAEEYERRMSELRKVIGASGSQEPGGSREQDRSAGSGSADVGD